MKKNLLSIIAIMLGLAGIVAEAYIVEIMSGTFEYIKQAGDVSPTLVYDHSKATLILMTHMASLILAIVAVFKKQKFRWLALAVGILSAISFFTPMWMLTAYFNDGILSSLSSYEETR